MQLAGIKLKVGYLGCEYPVKGIFATGAGLLSLERCSFGDEVSLIRLRHTLGMGLGQGAGGSSMGQSMCILILSF